MARIRSIKPEFWASEQVGSITRDARLLFIGLWNFCDDRGIHPDSVKRMKAQIFPYDAIPASMVETWLGELIEVGLVERYIATDGNAFVRITGWAKHQKIDQPYYKFLLPGEVVLPANFKRNDSRGSAINTRSIGDRSANDRQVIEERSPPDTESEGKGRGREKEARATQGGDDQPRVASPVPPVKNGAPPSPGTAFVWDPSSKTAFQVDGSDFKPAPAAPAEPATAAQRPRALSPASPEARALCDRFLAARERHWPDHPDFPAPMTTLTTQAEGILGTGLPADTVMEVIERYLPKDAKAGRSPPGSFAAFRRSLEAAAAAASKANLGIAKVERPKAKGLRIGSPEWKARQDAMMGDGENE